MQDESAGTRGAPRAASAQRPEGPPSAARSTRYAAVAPETPQVLSLAALLTGLTIGVVPVVAVLLDLDPLPLLAGALLGYAALVLVTRTVAAGVVAALPVLATINADVPLLRGPSRTVDLAVVLGDLAVVAAIGLLAWLAYADRASDGPGNAARSSRTDASRTLRRRVAGSLGVPGLLLAGFALWAVLGAATAAHDPQTAAVFGVNQFRYVVYFAVAAGLVASGIAALRALAGGFVLAMLGHTAFALAEFAVGGDVGLTSLGQAPRDNELVIVVLGEAMPMGRFLGGLVGNNAAYASLAVPAVAVLVWVAAERDGIVRRLAALAVVPVAAVCVPLSQYDSATVAFVLTLGLALLLAALRGGPRRLREPVARHRVAVTVAAAGAVLAVGGVVAVAGAHAVLDALPLVGARNLGTRVADYGTAVEVAREHPLFGYGGGNVEPVASELGFSDDIAIHSVAFSYLAETGVVGLLLWTGAVVATAARALDLAWSDRREAGVAAALCVGAVGFLVVAMVDQIWDNHTSMGTFWLFAGAVVAASRR